jgi:diguanylate cyclase (GGDEF)-like protein
LDLDNFKACNDLVSWTFGDTVLKAVARTISQSTHQGDIAARWGGDEFALLFLKGDALEVAERIERLCSGIAALRFNEHPGVSVSASVGYANVFSADEFDAAFAACQTALREAKAAGGNAVRVESV